LTAALALDSKEDKAKTLASSANILKALSESLIAQILTVPKGAESKAVEALGVFATMANEAIFFTEPYLVLYFSDFLKAASHKNDKIRAAAETTVQAIASKVSPNALGALLPHIFKCSEVGVAWQTRALALKTLASFGDHAPEQLGNLLPDVSCVILYLLWDILYYHIFLNYFR
jgi:hypothetical protein